MAASARGPRRQRIKPPNASCPAECVVLEQLPNIGPALAAELRLLGISHPQDLLGQDGYLLYRRLCEVTRMRHDPCVLDTFLAATDFMRGAPATPWWQYTAQRKQRYGLV
jgi:hypothetical protein